MNRSIATVARRALGIGFGSAVLALAGAAAAQTYAYEPYSGSYADDAAPAYSYSYQSPTYTYPSGSTYSYSTETTTSSPVYSDPAYAYPAPAYSAPVTPYTDGITVYGRRTWRGGNSEHPELSRPVSYRDLDLRTEAGVAELKARIARTARRLCSELGEPPAREQNTAVLPSCQAAARDSAYQQVQAAVDSARYWASR